MYKELSKLLEGFTRWEEVNCRLKGDTHQLGVSPDSSLPLACTFAGQSSPKIALNLQQCDKN